MITRLDDFASAFDATELLSARSAPVREAPGFSLLDDGEGRFVIDRETGVITLASQDILEREAGAVHAVRLRVITAKGEPYEQSLRLVVSGLVPQLEGWDDDLLPPAEASAAPVRRTDPLLASRVDASISHVRADAPFGALSAPFLGGTPALDIDLAAPALAPAAESAWRSVAAL